MRLTQEQRNAVSEPGHVCLVSCPGSGKTRTIVAKLLRCVAEVENTTRRVACITHTNVAADEVDCRLRQLCFGNEGDYYEVSTIHAFALQNVLAPYHRLLPELVGGFEVLTSDSETYVTKAEELIGKHNLKKFAFDEFERIQRDPGGALRKSNILPAALMAEWFQWLDQNGYVTFNDMLFHAGRLISAHTHIASSLASRFAWILVDEFQDSAAGQILLLKAIHGYSRTSFFCVGDPNQSIYRFAGASPALLTDFAAHVGANTSHRLTGNFRSSANIIELVEKLCPTEPGMQAVGRFADWDFVPSHHTVDDAVAGITDHFLPLVNAAGIELGKVAILAPWWLSLFHLGHALRQRGIPAIGPGARPYKRSHLLAPILEGLGAYLESAEAAIILAVQRSLFILLSNLTDTPAYEIYSFKGRVVVCRLLAAAREARMKSALAINWIGDMASRLGAVLTQAEFLTKGAMELIRESADAMISDVRERAGGDTLSTEDMAVFARPGRCIHLLTVHKSKGREFEAVAVVDAHDGRFPHFSIESMTDPIEKQAEYDESRRVVYVAATRAQRLLMFFTDRSHYKNRPSPFLREMGL